MMTANYFTLEALNAKHGDALLLHFGTSARPQHILIDGGPSGIYRDYLAPRLKMLGQNTGRDSDQLQLLQVYLSHIDDDHIAGLLDLLDKLRSREAPCKAPWFLFNAFEDAKAEIPPELAQLSVLNSISQSDEHDGEFMSAAVLASVGQGRSMRDMVRALGARTNLGDGKLLLADDKPVDLLNRDGLRITLVAPSKQRMQQLFADWKRKSAKATGNKAEIAALLAAYTDASVYNLSSLVFVVEYLHPVVGTMRMLLTGDARGDDIVAGLNMAGLLNNGKAHFNILKMPHHGSARNMTERFLNDITADHYLISADGRHDNPDAETLEWIGRMQNPNPSFEVVLTNDGLTPSSPALKDKIAKLEQRLGRERVRTRMQGDLSISVELSDPINF